MPTGESRSQHNRRTFGKKQMSLVVSNGNYYDERQLNSPAGYEVFLLKLIGLFFFQMFMCPFAFE